MESNSKPTARPVFRFLSYGFLGLAVLLIGIFLIYDRHITRSGVLVPNVATNQIKPIITGPKGANYDVYVTPEQYRAYFLFVKGVAGCWALLILTLLTAGLDRLRANRAGSSFNVLQDWSGDHAVSIDRAIQIAAIWINLPFLILTLVGVAISGGLELVILTRSGQADQPFDFRNPVELAIGAAFILFVPASGTALGWLW